MSVSLTVMTFNLHRDCREEDGEGDEPTRAAAAAASASASASGGGGHTWESRRDLCITIVSKYAPTILCTQEGLQSQLEDLERALPGYGHFGLSRKGLDDATDEHCSVFYNKEQVEQSEGGTFWLSESPSIPASMSWGAAAPCIATWVTFQFKGVEPPGFSFQIVNTHLDKTSARARRRGALLTWQHIASLPPSLPVLYCGGFNTEKESAVGRFLLGRSREHGVVGDMFDAWASARRRKSTKLVYTYHGFKGENQGTAAKVKLLLKALFLCWDRRNQDLHVDWILFRGRSLTPIYAEVVDDNASGHYPSDHYPLYVEFSLPRSVRHLDETTG